MPEFGDLLGKKAFMGSLFKNIIKIKEFIPLQDEEGEICFDNGVYVLLKNSFGAFMILELIDGDVMSPEEIAARLKSNEERLLQMNAASYHYVIEIFVFDHEPVAEKEEVIVNHQIHKAMDKRFLKCMSIQLDEKKIIRHFKTPLTDFGLRKVIKSQFQPAQIEEISFVEIKDLLRQREEEYKLEFKAKTPVITYGLIAVNILIWVAMNVYALKSGVDVGQLLIGYGAKENLHIMNGEYWRFLTPILLHVNIIHLALNSYSLYALGPSVERIFGHIKFFLIYILAGVLGNIISFAFSPNSAVGASGAIFGLMGALLFFGLEKPSLFKVYFGYNVIVSIVANLAYGFSRAGIDNYGHIGGLVGGFLASGSIVKSTNKLRWYLNRLLFFILLAAVTLGGAFYGFTNKQNNIPRMIDKLQQSDSNQNWEEAEKTAERILDLKPADKNLNINVFWVLIKAEALSKKYTEAVDHAKQLQQLDPAKGHYILGIIYLEMEQYTDAKTELLEAKRLNAQFGENVDALLEQIDKVTKNK